MTKKTINVTLVAPTDLQTGTYQGFLNFDSGIHSVNAPVSFVIKQLVDKNNSKLYCKEMILQIFFMVMDI